MHVRWLGGESEVHDEISLREALGPRVDGRYNEFLCWHQEGYPLLAVWVNGEVACVAFWRGPDLMEEYSKADGVVPVFGSTEVRSGTPTNVDERPNAYVVKRDAAISAALEFMRTGEKPAAVEWVQL